MPDANLSTHSLEAQRKLLLHSVRALLDLETSIRRARSKLSLDKLNERLLLLSRLAHSMLQGDPWPAAMPTPCQLACELWRCRVDAVLTAAPAPSPAGLKTGVY